MIRYAILFLCLTLRLTLYSGEPPKELEGPSLARTYINDEVIYLAPIWLKPPYTRHPDQYSVAWDEPEEIKSEKGQSIQRIKVKKAQRFEKDKFEEALAFYFKILGMKIRESNVEYIKVSKK